MPTSVLDFVLQKRKTIVQMSGHGYRTKLKRQCINITSMGLTYFSMPFVIKTNQTVISSKF